MLLFIADEAKIFFKQLNTEIMKTIFIITGVMLLLALPLNMQAQELHGGIKGGLNLSYLNVNDADKNKLIPGFNAGVWAKFGITDVFGIQPEILYSTKGVKSYYGTSFLGFDITNGESKLHLNYLEIPLYLTFNLADIVDVHVGPYIGILLDANIDTQDEILQFINVSNSSAIDRTKFHTLDAGLSFGLGAVVKPMTFGVNYSLGFNPVAKDGESTEDLLGDAKNHTLQVYAGFGF